MALLECQEIFLSPNIFPNPRPTVTETSPLTCFLVKRCPLQAFFNKLKYSPGWQLTVSLTPWPENRHQMPSLLTTGTRMLGDEEPAESYKAASSRERRQAVPRDKLSTLTILDGPRSLPCPNLDILWFNSKVRKRFSVQSLLPAL